MITVADLFYSLRGLKEEDMRNLNMKFKNLAIDLFNDIIKEKSYENPFRLEGYYKNLDSLIKRMVLVSYLAIHKHLNPHLSYLFEENLVKMALNKIGVTEIYQHEECISDTIQKEGIMKYHPAYYVDNNTFNLKVFERKMIWLAVGEKNNGDSNFNIFHKFILYHIPISRVMVSQVAHVHMRYLVKKYGNEEIQEIFGEKYRKNILKSF